MSQIVSEAVVIDVRAIPKPQRHPLIFEAMEALAIGESLVVKNDHNPIPLRGQVEAIYGEQFAWNYLEEGPDVFRLQFTRRAKALEGWHRAQPKKNELPLANAVAPSPPVRVDLLERAAASSHSGPQWAHESEDLDVTLLSWEDNKRIESHINNEVDGVLIGIEGSGVVTVNGEEFEMRPGVALLIPKGCERAIQSTSARFSYLSVHKRRRGLMPTIGGAAIT